LYHHHVDENDNDNDVDAGMSIDKASGYFPGTLY
jgi:hypothetical protein